VQKCVHLGREVLALNAPHHHHTQATSVSGDTKKRIIFVSLSCRFSLLILWTPKNKSLTKEEPLVMPVLSLPLFCPQNHRCLFHLGLDDHFLISESASDPGILYFLKTLPHFLRRCPKKSCAGSNNISSLSSIHFLMSSVVYAYTSSYHQSCMISKACFAVQHIWFAFCYARPLSAMV
jgi:hypothetical protein